MQAGAADPLRTLRRRLRYPTGTTVTEFKGMPLEVGTRLGPYEILAQIGAGGMGEVYRASDTRLDRHVALKVIAPQWARDRQVRMRFEREARAISALSHPHVCTLHDIGEHGDLEYLVMEFVEGETLADRLSREPLSVEDFLRYGAEIADALEVAHARGITHRDLKPSNVMITARGVKILDFGLAKLGQSSGPANDATDLLTNPGTTLGTWSYMSPEQAVGEEIGPPSDVFSLGIVFYEALTGRHPFEAGNRSERVHAILRVDPVRPAMVRPGVPGEIDALLLQMMQKVPASRPTAAHIRSVLGKVAAAPAMAPALETPARTARHVVGRERERAALLALLAQDAGTMISVTGEAGLGKTTLVEECLASLRGHVAVGRCSERLAGSEAYLPVLEALAEIVRNDPTLAHSMKLMAPAWHRQVVTAPDSSPQPAAPANSAAGQERLKREMATFFDAATEARRFILFFDDIHWADASTIDLLGYLGRQGSKRRLFMIVTARPSELLLQKHPFLELSRELQTRGGLHELSLAFLNWENVRDYLGLEFPANEFPDAFHQLVYEKTEGSPLFMVDLLRYLRDQDFIADTDGPWRLTRDVSEIEREIPASVRSMIERKIDQLTDEERKILIAASVQGAEFDSAVVAQALHADAGDIEETLDRLDRVHQFISCIGELEHADGTPARRYRFVHVLYQNSLYGSLGPARRASLSAQVADALLSVASDKLAPIASQLALLFENARDYARATDFFVLAAQHARRLFANLEAILLARRGIDAANRISRTGQRDPRGARLQELLGEVLALIGQYDAARDSYEESMKSLAEDDALARARVNRKLANVFVAQHSYVEAAAAFDRAEQVLGALAADSTDRWYEWIEMQLDRGWMFYWRADVGALDQLATNVQPHLATRALPAQRAKFLHVLVIAGFRRDRYAISERTLELAKATLEAATEAADPEIMQMGEFMVGFCHMWRNELDPAERFLQSCLMKSEKTGDIVLQSRCLTYLTVVARKRRDDVAVRGLALRSLDVASAAKMPEYIAVAKGNLAWFAWRQGDTEETLRIGFEVMEIWRGLPPAHGPNWWTVGFPMISTLVDGGRVSEAVEIAAALMGPMQLRLTDTLHETLGEAVRLWNERRDDDVRQRLRRACKLAEENLLL